MTVPLAAPREDSDTHVVEDPARPWKVVVWDDPINLMDYVTWVFRTVFGYSKERATHLMLQVHHEGRAIVADGPKEQCEMHVYRLHTYGLWATLEQDD